MLASLLLWGYLQSAAPVRVVTPGDVVTVVETADRNRYVVRSADLRGGAVARYNLACPLADDQRGLCGWLSEVSVDDAPVGEADGGLPTITRKGAL